MICTSQRPLPDNTQHSQQTNIHAPRGIRIHNTSKRATADPLLRPRGHWDQRLNLPRGSKFKTDTMSTKQETFLHNKDRKCYVNAFDHSGNCWYCTSCPNNPKFRILNRRFSEPFLMDPTWHRSAETDYRATCSDVFRYRTMERVHTTPVIQRVIHHWCNPSESTKLVTSTLSACCH